MAIIDHFPFLYTQTLYRNVPLYWLHTIQFREKSRTCDIIGGVDNDMYPPNPED